MSRVGFVTFYPFRPHVEHSYFLSEQFKKYGNEVFFLNCPGFMGSCYTHLLKDNKNSSLECIKCRIGSHLSYTNKNSTFISNIEKKYDDIDDNFFQEIVTSSAYKISRIEDPADKNSKLIKNKIEELVPMARNAFYSTLAWIKDNKLDYVVLFNGRMDLNRAAMEACYKAGVKFLTHERTTFGNGLRVIPNNNVLSLKSRRELSIKYKDSPLTKQQSKKALSILINRFAGKTKEYRHYNLDSVNVSWPILKSKYKVLILPSSLNERMGHPEHEPLDDPRVTFERVIENLGVSYDNCVLRAHPNWSEKIGSHDGSKINSFYKKWAKDKNIHFIESTNKANTRDLIKEADFIIVNGSSAAFEANYLRTPSICVTNCFYDSAEISIMMRNKEEVKSYTISDILNYDTLSSFRKTLRFLYTTAYRFPFFVDKILCETTTSFNYRNLSEDDVSLLIHVMDTSETISNDTNFSESINEEDEIIQSQDITFSERKDGFSVRRRGIYRIIDLIRPHLKRGDL